MSAVVRMGRRRRERLEFGAARRRGTPRGEPGGISLSCSATSLSMRSFSTCNKILVSSLSTALSSCTVGTSLKCADGLPV